MAAEEHRHLVQRVRQSLADEVQVDVKVYPAGEAETGLWCDSCLLPSRFKTAILTEVSGGTAVWITPIEGCSQCGAIRLNPPS